MTALGGARGRDRGTGYQAHPEEHCVLPWRRGGDPLWALLFPASYTVGMANLGMQLVAYGLQELGVGVERFFLSLPPLFSLESGRPLGNFPVITASMAFEPDVLEFFCILRDHRIPLSWKERRERNFPLVGVGGALCSLNPALFQEVADFVLVGDAEPALPFLVETIRRYLHHGDRQICWETLDRSPTVLVPPLENSRKLLQRSVCHHLDDHLGHSVWIAPESAFGKTFLLELQRGCCRGCPYCTLPSSFSPRRIRGFPAVRDMLARAEGVASQVGLVTPEAGDYPYLSQLLEELRRRRLGVSFASLRVDALTAEMVEALTDSQRSSVTIAPETSERLRGRCGKPFSDALILEKLHMCRQLGIKKVKLYCMTGLPGEEDEDLEATARLAASIVREVGLDVVVGANTFIPKPGSGWAQAPFVGLVEGRRKMRFLESALGRQRIPRSRWALRSASVREAALEYALTWADAQTSALLTQAVERGDRVEAILFDRISEVRQERCIPPPQLDEHASAVAALGGEICEQQEISSI